MGSYHAVPKFSLSDYYLLRTVMRCNRLEKKWKQKDFKSTDLRVKKRKQMSISYRGGKKYPDGYTFVSCRKKLGLSNAINSIKW